MTAAEARALTDARRNETRVDRWVRIVVEEHVPESAKQGYATLVPALSLYRHREDRPKQFERDVQDLVLRLKALGYTVEVTQEEEEEEIMPERRRLEVSW